MISDLFKCEILLLGNSTPEEIESLIKREEITYLANQRLAKGEISWQDYLDLLEVCEVNIDEFLNNSDANCFLAGF